MKKMMITSVWPLALAMALAGGASAAQEEPKGLLLKRTKEGTPLRVQVTFSRFQGEKKVGSMPYTLAVNADDRPTVVRAGIQVPIMVNLGQEKGTTVSYKDVGNNLDCSAETLGDGRFKLSFTLEQGSVQSTDGAPKSTTEPSAFHAPVLRTFRTQSNVILRDGQSAQYVAATDPVSGEMVKIDVTLNLVK
jgi:Flp pilus assembly secretin CpaC